MVISNQQLFINLHKKDLSILENIETIKDNDLIEYIIKFNNIFYEDLTKKQEDLLFLPVSLQIVLDKLNTVSVDSSLHRTLNIFYDNNDFIKKVISFLLRKHLINISEIAVYLGNNFDNMEHLIHKFQENIGLLFDPYKSVDNDIITFFSRCTPGIFYLLMAYFNYNYGDCLPIPESYFILNNNIIISELKSNNKLSEQGISLNAFGIYDTISTSLTFPELNKLGFSNTYLNYFVDGYEFISNISYLYNMIKVLPKQRIEKEFGLIR